ncbi:MAG TPA: aquaporin, partial [Actinomycetes bacterium]|nr:aquaporin [Actinomycetes bacterium]
QIVGTAFLVMFVFALVDRLNLPPGVNLAPLLVGLAVGAIGMSYGANAGYAINPARDFGPRFLAWLTGWGEVALPGIHNYVWVPIVGPLVGGVVGAIVYDVFIHQVLGAREVPGVEEEEPAGRVEPREPVETTPE